ncbi:MAG: hypothetical protein QXI93_02045 [Candidatus Methanomethylicia archaeon]
MQKTKTLLLISLVIITFLAATILYTTPTLAKKDCDEKKVEVKVISVEVIDGKIWVTIGIFKDGVLIKTVTFDPPGGAPGPLE